MKRIKNFFTATFTATLSAAVLVNSMICNAAGSLYITDYNYDAVESYFIIGLENNPISCYPEAQENGVDKFIHTEEGKLAFEAIMQQHDDVKNKIEKILGHKLDVKYDYTAAYNGFSAAFSMNELSVIEENQENLGIIDICHGSDTQSNDEVTYDDASYDGTYEDFTEKIYEAAGITESSLNGDGTVIAVIDSSFDYNHEFLTAPDNFSGRIQKNDVMQSMPYLSAAPYINEKSYFNEKIPYRFDYGSFTYDTLDYSKYHGTHVAGIAAGNGEAETSDIYNPRGVAPNAQLLLLSVSLYTDECMAAYDDALYLGADIINASYGIDGVTQNTLTAEKAAVENITSTGVIFCTSAGNNGKNYNNIIQNFMDYSTSGYPDNISSALSVGSAENIVNETEINKLIFSDGTFEAIDSGNIVYRFSGGNYVYTHISGRGDKSDYKNLDMKNKIALVKESTLTYEKQIQNAADAGALGILIYADENSDVEDIESQTLPVGMISYESAQKLINSSKKIVEFYARSLLIKISDKINMSDSSAWDFTEQLILKPDIIGFGGNIISSAPKENDTMSGYRSASGTSMSAPFVAGISSLLLQHINENKGKYNVASENNYNELIAKLLMSTATPVYTSDSLEIASPRVQGNGLANISDAVNTPCYISTDSEKDCFRPKLSLGDGFNQSYDLTFNITNISDKTASYSLATDLFKDTEDENGNIAWNTLRLTENTDYAVIYSDESDENINSVSIPDGTTKKVTAKITLSDAVYNQIKNDGGRFVDGFVRLYSNDNPNLTLSFMTYCGDWAYAKENSMLYDFIYNSDEVNSASILADENTNVAGFNVMDMHISQPVFSPSEENGDGVFDTMIVSLKFKRRFYDLSARILNSKGEEVYSEYLSGTADVITENIDFDINWDFKEDGVIKNNETYTIELSGVMPLSEESIVIGSQQFTVDTEKPVVKNVGVIDVYGYKYLIIDAEDNVALQGAANYDEATEKFYALSSINSSKSGKHLIVDISENKTTDTIEIYDMAGNYTEVKISDVHYMWTTTTDTGFGYALTDEEDFYKNHIIVTDEYGNVVDVDISSELTPSEVSNRYGTRNTEVSLLIDGFETVAFEVNAAVKGDANSDGICNVRDAAYLAKLLSNKTSDEFGVFMDSISSYCSDMNDDGYISVRDAAALANMLAHGKE